MYWYRRGRPDPPADWGARVRDAKREVRRRCKGRQRPVTEARADGSALSEDELFPPLWRKGGVKRRFKQRQHARCGYCESAIDAACADGGDVEHYRPKAELKRLSDDATTWGTEAPDGNHRATPRSPVPVGIGYWWLAYEWSNYLLACGVCNRSWKGCLFPVQGGHAKRRTPTSVAREVPLLLDPYGAVNPARHLRFDETGQIHAATGSEVGVQTIRTCHLTRESLRSAREYAAKTAFLKSRAIVEQFDRFERRATRDMEELRGRLSENLRELIALGSTRRGRSYTGMVRMIWRGESRLPWRALREMLTEVEASTA